MHTQYFTWPVFVCQWVSVCVKSAVYSMDSPPWHELSVCVAGMLKKRGQKAHGGLKKLYKPRWFVLQRVLQGKVLVGGRLLYFETEEVRCVGI